MYEILNHPFILPFSHSEEFQGSSTCIISPAVYDNGIVGPSLGHIEKTLFLDFVEVLEMDNV